MRGHFCAAHRQQELGNTGIKGTRFDVRLHATHSSSFDFLLLCVAPPLPPPRLAAAATPLPGHCRDRSACSGCGSGCHARGAWLRILPRWANSGTMAANVVDAIQRVAAFLMWAAAHLRIGFTISFSGQQSATWRVLSYNSWQLKVLGRGASLPHL